MSLTPVRTPPLELFPYQRDGAEWVASRERGGLLDLPGVGKSGQIVRAVDLRRAARGVVVCPAHLRANWLAEFRKFGHFERRISRGATIHDFVAWSRGVFDVLLLSYEQATKWVRAGRFDEHGEIFDFLAIDEFHYLNGRSSARAKAILGEHGDGVGGLAQWAAQAWAVTGTLMHNDPSNAYTFLRFVGATDMPYATFVRRYFHSRPTTFGTRCRPKEDRVEELRGLLTANSISRTLEAVGHQLPPIFLTTHLVEGDTDAIRGMLAEHPGLDEAIVRAVRDGGLSFLDAQHVATMRRLIAEAKALPYVELLLGEIDEDPDRKVVVMGISRQALQTVHEVLVARGVGCVLVQGGVPEKARDEMVKRFQSEPACRVFVGNMRAGRHRADADGGGARRRARVGLDAGGERPGHQAGAAHRPDAGAAGAVHHARRQPGRGRREDRRVQGRGHSADRQSTDGGRRHPWRQHEARSLRAHQRRVRLHVERRRDDSRGGARAAPLVCAAADAGSPLRARAAPLLAVEWRRGDSA